MSIGERRPPLFENRNRGLSDEFVQEVVHEMKDELNGISVFNPLGGEQSLLPILTDLIVNRNVDDDFAIEKCLSIQSVVHQI